MKLKEEDIDNIRVCVARANQDALLLGVPIIPQSPSGAIFGVLLWDPSRQFNLQFQCPVHGSLLSSSGEFVDGTKKSEEPRKLYHLERNLLLVSCRYKCTECSNPFYSHDDRITKQIPEDYGTPFLLFHRSGFSLSTFNHIGISSKLGKLNLK